MSVQRKILTPKAAADSIPTPSGSRSVSTVVSIGGAGMECGNARALTLYRLYASVVAKDPYQAYLPRAKSMLEKVLASDPAHLPVVYLLARTRRSSCCGGS